MNSMTILDRFEKTQIYQYIRKTMNRSLTDYFESQVFKEQGALRVAEVACGSGYGAHLISKMKQVDLSVAADINLDDYKQAGLQDYSATFVLMDIFHPSNFKGAFDFVWNSSSIEELSNPLEAVRQLAWMTSPGGYIFVGVPNRFGPAGWLRILTGKRYREWLGTTFNRLELRNLMRRADLHVVHEINYLAGTFIGALAKKLDQ